jgi:hypothetical protein
VHRDQEVPAKEEVHVVRGEAFLARPEVDAVQHDVQKAVVGLDLRVLQGAHRRVDGQRMEIERVGEDQGVGTRRRRQVDPDHRA